MATQATDAAFPLSTEDKEGVRAADGLTKREYFAALALQGLLAGGAESEKLGGRGLPMDGPEAAREAVRRADALIAALNAPKEPKP